METEMDEPQYSLADIGSATGISYEKLRYVVDQKVLPREGAIRDLFVEANRGRGNARTYDSFAAFGLASAALLLGVGLKPRAVVRIMDMLCQDKLGAYDCPLCLVFQERERAALEIGDLLNLRLWGSEDAEQNVLDTGWRQVETGALLQEYEPMVVVSLNVAKLQRRFQQK